MTPEETRQQNLQFKSRCLINLDGVDLDTPVYRVYHTNFLLQLFAEKKNTLVKPRMWDDPFENLVFQQTATLDSGAEVSFESIRERYYGQCWTLNTEETDALWRIYSPEKMGVRVKTTLRKLWDSFYDPSHKWAMVAFNLGKIEYATEAQLREHLEDPENLHSMIFDSSANGGASTLLYKRAEFAHENEVRLIYGANVEEEDLSKPIYQYPFDANNIIDELLFDPRYNDALFDAVKGQLTALGFTKQIEKSKLYQLPSFNLRLNV